MKHVSTTLALLACMGAAHADGVQTQDSVKFMDEKAMAAIVGTNHNQNVGSCWFTACTYISRDNQKISSGSKIGFERFLNKKR